MDRRAKMQLLLQQAVETLSVAAIAYYAAGLIGYLAKGLKSQGVPLDVDLVVAVSIPFLVVLTGAGERTPAARPLEDRRPREG
jgi:uncharacterized membrane-anchored protein